MPGTGSIFNTSHIPRALVGAHGGHFPSPWLDLASLAMPEQNKNALEWCEFVYDAMGTYRQAQERTISYFLTEVLIGSADPNKALGDDEKDKWRHFLNDTLGIMNVLQMLDRDRACYGNGFATVYVPFMRFLVCPQCHSQFPLREVYTQRDSFNFEWQLPKFIATCPACKTGRGYRGEFRVNDMPEDLENNLRVKIWPVHEIEILHDLYSDQSAYIWRIPEDYKKQVRTGHLWHLERASMPVIRAIQNNNLFMFHPEVMFHMREPVVSGRRHRGWGISRIIYNFRQIWYVQVLRRYNEAIGLDYIIPFRLITPEVRSGSGAIAGGSMTDPSKGVNLGNYSAHFMRLMAKRRRDPAGWHFLPFPVRYTPLGGDANNLAPQEILDQGYDVMLNDSGFPADLYRGSLQLQTAPVALRLFEATWTHLVTDNNAFLRWLVNQISQILSWERVDAKLRRVTYADDFNIQMAQLQLMMGQAISQTTGLRSIGLDWDDEQRQIAEESRRQAELQAEIQEEMEQSAFGEQIAKGQPMAPGGGAMGGGAMGGGAMPPGAAGAPAGAEGQAAPAGPVTGMIMSENVPQSMDDLEAQAEALASELLALPESQRLSELRLLKEKHHALHALVRAYLDEMRGRARTAGQSLLLGQQGAAA